jgi:hypothetical protein
VSVTIVAADISIEITSLTKSPTSVCTVIREYPLPGGPDTGFGVGAGVFVGTGVNDGVAVGVTVGVGVGVSVGVGSGVALAVGTGVSVTRGIIVA